ncbi:MAG TPA: hypothetical protein VFA32_06815 [Dehalococcoidia bacterium]|nr:hypothetical protein [Dehalococcoidia bacterium]
MNILRRYWLILAIAAGVAVWWFFIRDEEGPEPEPEPEPTLDGEITALSGTASSVTSEIAYSVSIKNTGTIATSYRARTVFTAGSRTPIDTGVQLVPNTWQPGETQTFNEPARRLFSQNLAAGEQVTIKITLYTPSGDQKELSSKTLNITVA